MVGAEKKFEECVKKYLKKRGHWFVKYFGCAYSKAGTPDLLCAIKGHFVAIEVKAANGRASPLQLWNREEIRRAGGIAIILYPNKFEEFKELIKQIESGEFEHYMQFRFD